MSLVSIREYARHRGVSHTAVQKAIKTGRLARAVVNGKIDIAIADSEWPKGERETMREEFSPAAVPAPAPIPKRPEPTSSEPVSVDKVASTYQQSRAAREAFNAKLTKLTFDERSAKLVDADAVKSEAFKVARVIRDALLMIPDRLAPELAHESDAFKINKRMTEEIRKVLEGLKFDE